LKNWYTHLSRGSQIAVGTVCAHFFVLICLLAQHLIHFTPPKKNHITVNTVRISSPAPKLVVPKPVAAKAIVKPVPKAVAPIKTKPVVAAKKTVTPSPKKAVPVAKSVAVPKVEVKQAVAVEKKPELVVPVLPTSFMQQALLLPEYGQVRVEVSIDKNGNLEKFTIIDTKSEKNAEFLKNQLPTLRFPCLNEAVSLTIVFSNEL
jgi:hypothetical protein